ncbi:BppU family phage baseplate upper protein [Enterococcus faecium]|uniref:BppU family phage baseplate upper protein n=1 Tax=Enterococcus faecium TaxID=1352 RepID=UPI00338FC643
MASSLYNLALDFSKELNYTKAIMARQGDKGITVTVKPFLNGLQMDTSGGTFTLKGTTPSNRYVDSVATSVTSEEVTFSLDGTFMSEAGYYKHCYVEYRKDNQILTTQDIIFFSLGVSDISQGQADEYVSQLEELIRKYNETFDAFMAEIKKKLSDVESRIEIAEQNIDELRNDMKLSEAWAWSKDGTDRFTTVYPTENILLNTSKVTKLDHWISDITLSKHPFYKNGTENIFRIDNPNTTENYAYTDWYPASSGEWTFSFKGFQNSALSNIDVYVFWRKEDTSQTGFIRLSGFDNFTINGLTTKESLLTLPEGTKDVYIRIDNNGSNTAGTTAELWFIEPVLRKGNMIGVPYTPAPSEDYENAYPQYRGIGMRDSNNPKDYVWDLAPEYVEAEVTKKVAQVNSQLKEHVNDTNNPHEVTKNQVGLGNVDNFSTATQTEAEKGEASNKFMTPQRTTQMITKRIATDAEVVAGTDLNKLVTPKSLDIYYRDRTQVAVASYGTEDIALTAKEELSEASWRYRRIGDIVEFYGRFKLKEATDIVNVHELPTGFRLSTDFDDTSWNVPLNIQKAANPTSYVAGAFVERQGTNLLRVGGNSSGNHYVSGWWYTDDPFPTG